ncbi:DpnI domain-containing protein [Haloarcula salinisoli]|uniref:DpnI domain-containing protein n=1 Tax=Haloarcula salinisoli TaxID=2487746 RepID=A0A8J7YH59_9EURY|nr:DpnI domain-containing protein [Halomicroarcula salinisoli]MBX0285877.1 DpnI domain-containing protein [Halomicroarcula salinisoli]MBX0302629.1 DpnI domain-containing protein [Halomicroarcula salinisoli]
MTREKRTRSAVCPECDNNPVVMEHGGYFCDCCNEEFTRADLVQLN